MAIGAVARGDQVVVLSVSLGLSGVFYVDQVSGSDVYIFAVDDLDGSILAGYNKANRIHITTADIWAVYTADSISA